MDTATEDLDNPHDALALSGLRVVSMAEQYPGPFCTMILSDMGADVIQVERPEIGDPSRFLKSFYESLNRGKRSIALDIRNSPDKDRLIDLIKDSDVFLEGFRPGKLAKHGLGYKELSATNPRLIYVSISGFGQDGPYRDRPAHDITFQGIGGALDERISGNVTGTPPAQLLGDTASALYATIGLLSALIARERTGRGTYVDVAMADSVLALQTAFVGDAGNNDSDPPQAEPAYDLFQCADGRYLTLSIAHEDDYWRRLCQTLELEELAPLNRDARVADREALRQRIADVLNREDLAHWERVFEKTSQMWGPANTLSDVIEDRQFSERGMIGELMRADGVTQNVIRQPVRFSAFAQAPLRRAPELNEHRDGAFSIRSRAKARPESDKPRSFGRSK